MDNIHGMTLLQAPKSRGYSLMYGYGRMKDHQVQTNSNDGVMRNGAMNTFTELEYLRLLCYHVIGIFN